VVVHPEVLLEAFRVDFLVLEQLGLLKVDPRVQPSKKWTKAIIEGP